MITGALVDENRLSYALNSLGKDYLGETKNEKLLRAAAKEFGIDAKSQMYKLPPKYVGAYAEQDAALTLRLWHFFKNEISKQDLKNIWELETDLIPMMLDMKTQGVKVNVDGAERAKKSLQNKVKTLHSFIKEKSGVTVEPWASASVAKVFDALGEPYTRTEQGAPSFTKQWLQSHSNEVAQAIVRLREFDKADSTFIDTILRHETKGRIHAEFHQLRSDDGGTVTGRFSSSNPNLQQIPSRDKEIKSLIRGLFIPENGCRWGSFDYASQEPRLLVHFANLIVESPSLTAIKKAYDAGTGDLHQMVADIAEISRTEAKTVNLGIMYGMGKGKLAAQLSITKDEATDLLDIHHERVPFVKDLAKMASDRAGDAGSIRTLLGRKCRFDLYEPRSFGYKKPLPYERAMKEYGPFIRRAFTYKALNKLIQGSAADQTKRAMLDCYKEGLLPMLTVHDELCFSVNDENQARKIKDIMENGLSDILTVPSSVDDELVDNWGQVT
jgi:DNA polymerase I-like protein with 3'-5' exonuclease and polymerase domains